MKVPGVHEGPLQPEFAPGHFVRRYKKGVDTMRYSADICPMTGRYNMLCNVTNAYASITCGVSMLFGAQHFSKILLSLSKFVT